MTNNAYLPLAKLTERKRFAAENGILLTGSDRLRREHTYAYDHARMTAGDTAWREPSISGFEALLRRDHERARIADAECPKLLSAVAQHALFRSVAPDNLAHLTRLFEDAWKLVHAWQIDFRGSPFDDSVNTRSFAQWASAVTQALAKDNAITSAQLGSQTYPLSIEGCLHLTGFDVITLQQRQWLERAKQAGIDITYDHQETSDPEVSVIRHQSRGAQRFSSEVSELTAAIVWARGLLEGANKDQPPPRIAIVVPDLLQQHAAVTRLLHAHLEGTEERTEALYNVGGGLALAQHPLVESALQLLASIHEPTHYTLLERLLADPALPGIQAYNRLPEQCAEFLTLADIPQASGTDALRSIIRSIDQWGAKEGPIRTVRQWWSAAASVLRNARWHTARNDSEGFQATNALLDIMIAQPPDDQQPLRWRDAYVLLESVAQQTLFAPASTPAAIQVLGYLEAIELDFDHLWITGMSATEWPTPVSANPLLPPSELARVGAPRTTYASELEFAEGWLARVTEQPLECRASYVLAEIAPKEEKEEEKGEEESNESRNSPAQLTGISPLLGHWLPVEHAPLEASAHPLQQFWAGKTVDLQPQTDFVGSRAEPGVLRRATRRLENQAACPMRGWGMYTLDLENPITPHTLPNPLERGNLLHHALQQLYARVPSSDALKKLDPAAQAELCQEISQRQVEKELARFTRPFRRLETERLKLALQTFLQLESTRESFYINATEHEITGQLGPFEIHLQIDRIDDVADGQVVIDYKSTAPSLRKLLDSRLSAPQIPLYVLFLLAQGASMADLTFDDPLVRAGAFAELKPDTAKYVGLRDDQAELGMPPKLDSKQSWRQTLIDWRERLLHLSLELEAGQAKPDPANGACDNCELHSLCRYHLSYQ